MDKNSSGGHRTYFLCTALFAASAYLLGFIFPEALWAAHNPALLPLPYALVLLILSVLLFSLPFIPFQMKHNPLNLGSNRVSTWVILILSFIAVELYYQFPIAADYYGDAYFIRQAVDIEIREWDNRLLSGLLIPELMNTKTGLKTYYAINNFLTWLLGMNGADVSRVFSAVMGGVYVFIWLKFTGMHFQKPGWKWLFGAVGLSTPLMVVFMGHYETYFLSYTGILVWMAVLGIYFKTKSVKWLIALPFVFIIVLQTHITNWLLFPSMIIAVLWHFNEKKKIPPFANVESKIEKILPSYSGILSWKGIIVWFLVPAAIVGFVAYFFIYANHDGPRLFSKEEFENTLFLPLYTDEPAPYDRYNLFSPAHLLDYLNLMFMWGGAALMLLFPALTFLRRKIQWDRPVILASGLSVVLFFTAFFFLNPLLGPATDWDLFATPGIVVMAFLVFIYSGLENELRLRDFAGPVLGLVLLGSTFLFINNSPELLSKHLDHVGRHNFKTYWIGCSTLITGGTRIAGDADTQTEKLESIIQDLEPYAVLGNDKEYANLLVEQGRNYRNFYDDDATALGYFEWATEYSPLLGRNIYYLAITQFELGNTEKALEYARKLVEMKYQPYKRTLKIALHIALAASEYQDAANYAVTYLNRWQDDEIIAEIEERLRTGDRIDSLVELFDRE